MSRKATRLAAALAAATVVSLAGVSVALATAAPEDPIPTAFDRAAPTSSSTPPSSFPPSCTTSTQPSDDDDEDDEDTRMGAVAEEPAPVRLTERPRAADVERAEPTEEPSETSSSEAPCPSSTTRPTSTEDRAG
ncbi:hypothetical protein L6E12_16300 [Actinokineospora sp. PR83]|uniref:hypothetical protein n=1 Tax=Actinokineospora sp. PR83 TaxID=2884908 RepID=UPI001F255E8D|nr:hypothetical protein [Actinokineospora sp. PR83]MCG8917348.1 hypothetical protein [Actinokineospora sp. PR83]